MFKWVGFSLRPLKWNHFPETQFIYIDIESFPVSFPIYCCWTVLDRNLSLSSKWKEYIAMKDLTVPSSWRSAKLFTFCASIVSPDSFCCKCYYQFAADMQWQYRARYRSNLLTTSLFLYMVVQKLRMFFYEYVGILGIRRAIMQWSESFVNAWAFNTTPTYGTPQYPQKFGY